MKRTGFTAAAAACAAFAGMGVQTAHATPSAERCVTAQQASGLMLVLLPGALRAMQRVCATRLPDSALLRRMPPALLSKYETAAAGAWPRATEAIRAISGQSLDASQVAMVRPMLDAMAAPMLAEVIQPDICPTANRVATLLEPLPAENLAGLVVTYVELRAAEKAREARESGTTPAPATRSRVPDVTICPTTTTATAG